MILADTALPPLVLESITLSNVLLGTIGNLFLAYDLLGRENGPLRWFTLVLTGGSSVPWCSSQQPSSPDFY